MVVEVPSPIWMQPQLTEELIYLLILMVVYIFLGTYMRMPCSSI